jgi:CubicO group peptidase (beta-lactamase class C family)
MHPRIFARSFAAIALAMLAAFNLPAQSTPPSSLSANTSSNSTLQPSPPVSTPIALSAAQIADFRDYLSNARSEIHLPGLAVAIVQPGHVLLLEGFGTRVSSGNDTDISTPVSPDTRFSLGPVSQAINSLLLARLADARVIDLAQPARRCWSDFYLADPDASRNVTLADFLQMTAGIPDYVDHLVAPPHSSVPDLFACLKQIPVLAQPGEAFSYSEASASAAGYLATMSIGHILDATDALPANYTALVKAQLFDPLGMKRATYDPPGSDSDEAIGHTSGETNIWIPVPPTPAPLGALTPAHGLRASARDLAAWLQLELSGGLAPDGSRLLSEASVQTRWRPAAVRDTRQYGMGWTRQYYRGLELITSQANADNQAALIIILPRFRIALAVLLNGGGHPADDLLQDIQLNFADFLREASGGS